MSLKKKQKENLNLLDMLNASIEAWGSERPLSKSERELFIHQLLDRDGFVDLEKRPFAEVEQTVRSLWQTFQKRRFEDIHIELREDSFGEAGRVDLTIIQRQILFTTDSILNLLRQHHLFVSVMINATLKVRRDDDGVLLSIHSDHDYSPDLQTDKILHIQCENRGELLDINQLRDDISNILRDVHAAVEDWRAMQGQIAEAIDELGTAPEFINGEEAAEAASFLEFLKNGNFIFLGYREHDLRHVKNVTYFDIQHEKSLGILRDDSFLVFDNLTSDDKIPEQARQALSGPAPLLMVLKANRRATVHRHVHMDVILIKRYNKKGEVEALRLFSGLFTAHCYAKPTDQIPYLKQKVNSVLVRSGYEPNTHAWRALRHVLDSYPRDDLFQIDPELLYRHAVGINRLSNRPGVDVFIRNDALQRYFSVLVFLPKEQYDTNLRLKVHSILEEELKGHVVAHYLSVDEKPLARLQYTVACDMAVLPDYNLEEVRNRLIEACTPWFDRLQMAALKHFGKSQAHTLLHSLSEAFSVSYQDKVDIQHALDDLVPIQKIISEKDMVVTLRCYEEDPPGQFRIKFYKRGEEARLSELLPMLDRMGFHCLHEYSYEFKTTGGLPHVWLHELIGTLDYLDKEHMADIEPLFAEAFENIWMRRIDSDSFNTLTFAASLTWREANLMRAISRYLDLANYPLGKRYISQVLAQYPHITQRLRDLFMMRHDPTLDHDKAELAANGFLVEIDHLLDKVEKLDEDRVLRSILSVIRATVRTNYFHVDAKGKPLEILAFKFDAQNLSDLPKPRPYREIFIYSTRMEAIHLRSGPIARGGLRWSDRYEDFRTEILGLVKAQIVKNAVIVPVGSKGGFICKNQPFLTTAEERKQEGIACYQMMIRAMLSLTDNLVDNAVVPPANTVRLDGDDPYLVVAADKGTASFSDIANAISLEESFWLGDAFASGGSKGYDHKEMGITAKGAWECVQRHFRELNKDIQNEIFTVVGVGDMSGDVFGNGMLLSEKTQLIAAFDYRHIFIDPQPDAEKSFAERKRLFDLSASSWMDYNPKLLSKGGMIFNRQEKSLALTPEIQQLLDIKNERVTPSELIQAILRAKCELLYFGGIGTYIKASYQSHESVGDKGSDALRVNANELRCLVIGEGANLAMTQEARIEFCQKGGRCNTDFIDNSAGVDTSDHEVNIKILFNPLIKSKKITESDRDQLLTDMADEVSAHVLKNNYDQSLALSLAQRNARIDLGAHAQFMRDLEKQGLIDRQLEGLPNDDMLQRLAQRGQGLCRPELALLLAHAKITLCKQLMNSAFADDPALQYQLLEYFPDILQQNFKSEILAHKLNKEIIVTESVNILVNRMGSVFVSEQMNRTGASTEVIVKSWLLTRSAFDLKTLWAEVDLLDNKVSTDFQYELYQQIIDIMHEGVQWFSKHYEGDLNLDKLIPLYRDELAQLQSVLSDVLPQRIQALTLEQHKQLNTYDNLRSDIKKRFTQLSLLLAGCDVVYLHQKTQANSAEVAKAYFELSERLRISYLQALLKTIPSETSWAQEAIDSMEDELRTMLSDLTLQFLTSGSSAIEEWLAKRNGALHAIEMTLTDIERLGAVDLPLMTVVSQRMRRLVYYEG